MYVQGSVLKATWVMAVVETMPRTRGWWQTVLQPWGCVATTMYGTCTAWHCSTGCIVLYCTALYWTVLYLLLMLATAGLNPDDALNG
jgi:hypothetical protein